MKPSDFEKELLELDRDLGRVDLPAGVDARVRARLERGPRSPLRALLLVAAAGTALIILGVSFAPRAPQTLGGFATRDGSETLEAHVLEDTRVQIARGSVTLVDEAEGATLGLATGAEVRRRPQGAEVLAGTVQFEVAHRNAGPYSVSVSGGVIEVVGTRFVVKEQGSSGEVRLEQGVIRFHAKEGTVVTLAPGEHVSWPVAVVVPPPPEPQIPAPTRPAVVAPRPLAPAPAPQVTSVEEILSNVASLRSRGRFEEAATVLTSALKEPLNASTRERLSFELGAILSHQLNDPLRACAHWARHLDEFPQGRYLQAVTTERGELKCAEK